MPAMTAEEHRRREADRVARESERHAAENAAAKRAFAIWSNARPVTQHDYLTRKGVGAHDMRQSASGDLVVPLRDRWVRNVQTINPDGGATCKITLTA
jgi:putative DNA primase/helicase